MGEPSNDTGNSNPVTPLGDYGYMDYSEGVFYVFVYSQHPLASNINTYLTVTWDTWWSDSEGGGNLYTETTTTNQLFWDGDYCWTYAIPITYDMGIQSPGSSQKWGVQNLRWEWKTDKSGNSWADSWYNYNPICRALSNLESRKALLVDGSLKRAKRNYFGSFPHNNHIKARDFPWLYIMILHKLTFNI